MSLRSWFWLIAVACFGLALARVGWREYQASDSEKTVLTLLEWGDHFETAILRGICDDFERVHRGVRVQVIQSPDYDGKLFTMASSGSPPDVFYVPDDNLSIWADVGLLAPLDQHIAMADAQDGPAWRSDIHPGLMRWFRWDGSRHGQGPLYAIPFWHSGQVMYVNTDLFAKAGLTVPWNGWTWDEWEDACSRITALSPPTGSSERIWGGMLTSDQYGLLTTVTNQGGRLFGGADDRDDSLIALDEPAGMAALERIRRTRFVSRSVYSPPSLGVSTQGGTGAGLDFGSGRVGILGPARYGQSLSLERDQVKFGWDIVPTPHPKRQITSVDVGIAWAMAAKTRHPDLTFALLRHVSGPDAQRRFAAAGLAIPARSSAFPAVLERPGRPAHLETAITATNAAIIPHWPQQKIFLLRFFNQLDAALKFDLSTPAQAVSELRRLWDIDRSSPLHRASGTAMPWYLVTAVGGLAIASSSVVWLWWWRRKLHRAGRHQRTEAWQGLLFISPWAMGFVFLTLVPMGLSVVLVFAQWSPLTDLTDARWIGLANLTMLIHDSDVAHSLAVTAWYTVLAVPATQILALALALALSGDGWWTGCLRTTVFMTSLIGSVVVAALALWLFNNESGLLNAALRPLLSPMGLQPPDWLTRDATVWGIPALVLLSLWGVGSALVINIAALRGVSAELYEAARLDGAGAWRRFKDVTLPAISPVLQFNVIMAIVGSFQVFTLAYLVRTTGDSTRVIGLMIYDVGFAWQHMGYASALAWLLFAITAAITIVGLHLTRRMVHYEALR